MGIKIPEYKKSAIIIAWLMGKSRDNIALEVETSTGTVSNIVKQWENMVRVFDATNLRELGLALKKTGITPVQCANGLRIYNIINQLGIDENHIHDFKKNYIINVMNKKCCQLMLQD